jgi:AcrR family transcriptional regulator
MELVRAGRRLFSEKGIYEARVEDVAEFAGVGKGTLYLYFSSKQELVQAVVEAGFCELEHRLKTAVARVTSFSKLVNEVTRVHVEFFAANPDLLRIFHQVRGVLKFHRREWVPLRRPLEMHVEHLSRLLARVPSAVRGLAPRRKIIAQVLFGAVSGAISVRVALEARPRALETWAPLLSSGLTALAVRLAKSDFRETRARRRGIA